MKKITVLFVLLAWKSAGVAQDAGKFPKKGIVDSSLCAPGTRAMPSPLSSPPFPGGDWVGTYKIGAPNDPSDWALQKSLGMANNKSRVKIYGWINGSWNFSTSKNLNIPVSYDIIPNAIHLNQAVVRFERQPNTIQTDHVDWGFRISNVYGMDYRYTVARGWLGNGFFNENNLYGYDPVELYALLYIPNVAQGMVLRLGRFISPADIEAQLSPDNYVATHSVPFSYDPFTETGVQATIMISPQVSVEFAVHTGNDVAPWDSAAALNGQAYFRYVSRNNNNSVWAGVNALGPGEFKRGHDNMNHVSAVWGHRFNETYHMMTEVYYEWERGAALGGSANYGPVRYGAGGGPGPTIPGTSVAFGFVNYFQILISKKNFISIRNDYFDDSKGWRTGYETKYVSHTAAFIHQFTPWLMVRPEFRYDYNLGNVVTPYDLGVKESQFTATIDMVVRF